MRSGRFLQRVSIVALVVLTSLTSLSRPVAAATITHTTTADFDAGTKSQSSPADGVYETETITDNPHVTANAVTLGRINGDTFATADADSNTWRWRPIATDSEGCSTLLDSFSTSISSGAMHLSVTRTAGSTAWGYVRASFVRGSTTDISIKVTSTSPGSDFSEILDFSFNAVPNGCYFNSPTGEGVLYRVTRTSGTNLQLSAWTVANGVAVQIGTNTNVASMELCARIRKTFSGGTQWTWFYDASCTSTWTTDETTTFTLAAGYTRLYPILSVSDQVGASNAASWDVDDFLDGTAGGQGEIYPSGPRVTGSDSAFEGVSDYDAQIFQNAKGEMLYITGRGTGNSDDRIHVRWSRNGQTWSDRFVLFSNDAQADGIIDADLGGMWEFSGEVVSDTLYLVMHLNPPGPGAGGASQNAFTKIDITDIRNVETFSNWKSADGDAPPSSGQGTDGAGYDFISPTSYIDPSIAAFSASDIWVTMIRSSGVTDVVYIVRWNGVSWASPTAIYDDVGNLAVGLARLRRLNDGDLVAAFIKTQADAFNPVIVTRCDKSAAAVCTSSANWRGMDGAGSFDFAIDTGVGAFHWPLIVQDYDLFVHVVAVSAYLIGGFSRLFHNYWDGASWINAETENAAGTRVNMTINAVSEPRVVNDAHSYAMNAYGGGFVTLMLAAQNGPKGAGLYSAEWNGAWDPDLYTFRSFGSGNLVGTTYQRGNEVNSPFLLSPGTIPSAVGVQVLYRPGTGTGTPWWDSSTAFFQHQFRLSGTWTTPTTLLVDQSLTTITLGHSSLSSTAYIDRVDVLVNSVSVWSYTTDITAGTQTTLSPRQDVSGSVAVRVTLASNGASTPVLEDVEYAYEEVVRGNPFVPRIFPAFTYQVRSSTVAFQDRTAYEGVNALTYEWSFGDGITETGTRAPVHAYDADGIANSYWVTLTVCDGVTCRGAGQHVIVVRWDLVFLVAVSSTALVLTFVAYRRLTGSPG